MNISKIRGDIANRHRNETLREPVPFFRIAHANASRCLTVLWHTDFEDEPDLEYKLDLEVEPDLEYESL